MVQWAMGCSVCRRVRTQQAVQQSVCRAPSPRMLQHQAALPWVRPAAWEGVSTALISLQQSIPEQVIDPSIKGSGNVSPCLPAHPSAP